MRYKIKDLLIVIAACSTACASVGYISEMLQTPTLRSVSVTPDSTQVRLQLRTVGIAIGNYSIVGGSPRWPSLDRAIVEVAANDPEFAEFIGSLPILRKGKDRWGSELIVEYPPDGKFMVIRSCGPNKLDENGAGDDIEERVRVWIRDF